MAVSAADPAARRVRFTVPAVTGVAFTLSWLAGLAVPAPSPGLTAPGTAIAAALAGHGTAVIANFLFTEGLPAAGLAVASAFLARAIRAAAAERVGGAGSAVRGAVAARAVAVAGAVAAVISVTQFALGVALARASAPGTTHLLYELVNRLDGAKMLMLAVVASAAATASVLPSWLRWVSAALGIAMIGSGIGYLLLLEGMAGLAYVSGPLLLLFIPATGIAVSREAAPGRKGGRPCPEPA
jgi:hypothetical protein